MKNGWREVRAGFEGENIFYRKDNLSINPYGNKWELSIVRFIEVGDSMRISEYETIKIFNTLDEAMEWKE